MKIAFIYDAVYPYIKGGAEKRIYELSKRLVDRGHEVHWFGLKWWDGNDTIEKDGIVLHGVGKPMELYFNSRRSIKEALYFGLKSLNILKKKDKFDIIDCQEFPYFSCFSAKYVSYLKKSQFIITWLEVWGQYWNDYLGTLGIAGKQIELMVSKLARSNIAISKLTKDQLKNIGVKNVKVVPIGIDFDKIQKIKPIEREYDLIFVGRLIKDKNVDILIKAVYHLKHEIPDINVAIIGKGPEKQKLEMLARDLGVEKNIEFRGFLDKHEDVIAHMKASKIFVFPSTREGFGIVVLEANASGIPVVTTNHYRNASKDLIINGMSGFLANVSEKDFTEKIVIALNKGNKLRKNCLKNAMKYDWDNIVNVIEGIYFIQGMR